MTGKWLSRLLAGLVLVAAGRAAQAPAAAPWEKLLVAHRIEADPNKSYDLCEENGPWMIMACSFSWKDSENDPKARASAMQQAKDLVFELRKKYKLPAYAYKKQFELGKADGRGLDRFGNPVHMRYQHGADRVDEIAVLVGNYRSVEDPEGQEVLQKLKFYHPECLELKDGKSTNRTLAGWRMLQQYVMPSASEQKQKGPMGHAFLTTNPMLPPDFFVPKGIDKTVVKMNEGVENCLLDCPGKYTVQVAHFTGSVVLDQREIREITAGRKEMKSQLAEAAERAHLLTKALRKAGFEAYEFHDYRASIVTVGNFNSAGTPRADGKIEMNPEMLHIIQRFGSDPSSLDSQSVQAKAWAVEDGTRVPFDVQPIPVEVPRRSIAADYRRDVIGRR